MAASSTGIRRHEAFMAKPIEFYVPTNLRTPLKRKSRRRCGKVIEFYTQARKSG